MKFFSSLSLIVSLGITCLSLNHAVAETNTQTKQSNNLSADEMCPYQSVSGSGRRYWGDKWCGEQKEGQKKALEKQGQGRKNLQSDLENKEYWDNQHQKQAQERAYWNKRDQEKKYWEKKRQNKEYWERRERAKQS